MRKLSGLFLSALLFTGAATAQGIQQTKGSFQDKFRQLDEVLPTPNVYRTASGEPGHAYWQQAEQGEQKSQMPKNAQQEGFEVVGQSDDHIL